LRHRCYHAQLRYNSMQVAHSHVRVCISEIDWYSANRFFGRSSLMLTYLLLWARILAVTSHATAAAVTVAHC